MRNNSTFAYAIFLMIGDFLALTAAFVAAYVLRVKLDPRPLVEQIPALTYFYASVTVLPLWIAVHGFIGLYSQRIYEKRFSELGRILVGSFIGILVVIGYDFVSGGDLFPARLVPVYGLALGFSFLVIFRTISRILRRILFRFGYGISNVIIVGDTEATNYIADAIRNTKSTGFKVLATISSKPHGSIRNYSDFNDAIDKLRSPIHGIIQTELYKNQDKNNEILQIARIRHISYRFVPGNSDLFVGNIQVDLFAGLPIIAVHQTALVGWGRIVKRVFDIFASSILLVLLSPLFLIIAILQKVTDMNGEVFFKQTRLTRFSREFNVYKFRTPKSKYNKLSPEEAFELMGKPMLSKKYRENGDYLPNDPRFSTLGRALRASSLDELPQLINVLKGDISLVGPRALVPQELNAYEKKHTILAVKSGLTGLAQISGRRDISFEERRKLDLFYVQNWSFWMDISILIRTISAVIRGSGAK